MTDTTKLDGIIRKVRGLLARADHPNTPEGEANSCRAKAEQLMADYRVEESQLIETGGLKGVVPVAREMPVAVYVGEFRELYVRLAAAVLHHVGARGVRSARSDEDGVLMAVITAVGYDSDLRYAESLFQSARVVFADRMEPKPNSALSDKENVYRMRSAGMERIRVARLMGWGEPGTGKGGAGRVTRLYKEACEERGEDAVLTGKGIDVTAFREAYAQGFLGEFYSRLHRARNAVGSTDIVLAGREDAVNETFYTLYPDLRPSAVPATTTKEPAKAARPRKWTKADERRYQRMLGAASQAGSAAGQKAAGEINIKQSGRKSLDDK